MKFTALLLAAYSIPSLVCALPASKLQKPAQKARFIVEFEPSPNKGIHKRFIESSIDADVHHVFDHDHFLGMSFDMEDLGDETMKAIRQKPGVKNVWRAQKWQKRDLASRENVQQPLSPDLVNGVKELHDRGITGQGIVVGIIAPEADSSHPALKGQILPGYDFCNNTEIDTTKLSYQENFSTGLASIIAGNSTVYTGVAPGAKIRIYRSRDYCAIRMSNDELADDLLEALTRASSDKVDVIALPLFRNNPFPNSPVLLVLSRIAKNIPVVVSFPMGRFPELYSGSDLASADNVIVVGGYDTENLITWNATVADSTGELLNVTYVSTYGSVLETNSTYEVDYYDDVCGWDTRMNIGKGKFAIARVSPDCDIHSEVYRAFRRKYEGVMLLVEDLMLNYPVGPQAVSHQNFPSKDIYRHQDVPFEIASSNDILLLTKKNTRLTISFNMDQNYGLRPKPGNPGRLVTYTSAWGPTYHQGLIPHVLGPAGSVFGADKNGTYSIFSGTSYACLYVAGVVALYLSGHKNATVDQVRAGLISTAKLAYNSHVSQIKSDNEMFKVVIDRNSYAPLLHQGNGYIDPVAFYDSQFELLSEPYLNLNDTANRVANHTIAFKNIGNSPDTYKITHHSLQVVYARTDNGKISNMPIVEFLAGSSVSYSPETVTLAPGESASINVAISAPSNLDQSRAPIFSGTFNIIGMDGTAHRVPYVGMEFDVKLWPIWAENVPVTIEDYPIIRSDRLKIKTRFPATIKHPLVRMTMAYGTSILSFDLVAEDYNLLAYLYPPVEGMDGYYGPIHVCSSHFVPVQGPYPLKFALPLYRFSTSFRFVSYANGTNVPDGRYRLLYRALNVMGDAHKREDWSLGLTRPFELKLAPSYVETMRSEFRI